MCNISTRCAACALVLFVLPTSEVFASASVNYQGYVYREGGLPAVGDVAVAGTFAPGFNPSSIACTYGDFVCNVGTEYYALAVADGNILPIGNLVTVDSNGFFSGSGTTDAAAGTKIYLFGLPAFGGFQSVLGTSSDASFLVPAMGGTANVNAALANQFIFGGATTGGIIYRGMPIPEPSAITLAAVMILPLARFRRPQRQ